MIQQNMSTDGLPGYMPKMDRIILIRHGFSEANENLSVLRTVPDCKIALTQAGKEQAVIAGKKLAEYLVQSDLGKRTQSENPYHNKFRLWVSPYRRTRETADSLIEGLGEHSSFIADKRESLEMVEQDWGYFSGLTPEERLAEYPEEYERFRTAVKNGGGLRAKPLHGESRYDVCLRIAHFIGTIMRDAERDFHQIRNVIIISHGASIRAFIQRFLHLDYDWFESSENPKNCSIRLIEHDDSNRYVDRGEVFEGFGKPL